MGITQVIKIINVEDAPNLGLMSYFLGTQEISEGVTKDYKFSKEQILAYIIGESIFKITIVSGGATAIITNELFLNKKIAILIGSSTYSRDETFTQSNNEGSDGMGDTITLTFDKVNNGQIFYCFAI